MRSIPELIRKKRDGGEFSDEEIKAFVHAVTAKTIQDCQTGTNQLTYIQTPSFLSLTPPPPFVFKGPC